MKVTTLRFVTSTADDAMSRPLKHAAGFTLVELAIVIAALAILVSVLTPVVLAVTDQTARSRAERDAATLRDALVQLLHDTGAIRVRTAGEEGQVVYLLVSDGDVPTLRHALFGEGEPYASEPGELRTLIPGRARGRLRGGCVTLLFARRNVVALIRETALKELMRAGGAFLLAR